MKKRLLLATDTILQSRYRIIRQLGTGGMGAVYEAVDERIHKTVAVKETFAHNDDLRKAFEREAKLLARIEHRAFPQVTDYFSDGDGYYLVMDLIRGEDFEEILNNRAEPFEPKEVCVWADEILDALETLHVQHIIHRDIKPSNLKLTPDGRIKLLDFGIAKGTTTDTGIRTASSMAAASLQFAPLEQVLRANSDWYYALSVSFAEKAEEVLNSGTDARTDLYALGTTMYQMLTKRLPENAPTRALAIWSDKPDKLIPVHEMNPFVSEELSAVLQKAMELDARNRPRSAEELRKMLREAKKEKTFEKDGKVVFVTPYDKTAPVITNPDSLPETIEVKNTTGDNLKDTVIKNFVATDNTEKEPSYRRTYLWAGGGIFASLLVIGVVGFSFISYSGNQKTMTVQVTPAENPAPVLDEATIGWELNDAWIDDKGLMTVNLIIYGIGTDEILQAVKDNVSVRLNNVNAKINKSEIMGENLVLQAQTQMTPEQIKSFKKNEIQDLDVRFEIKYKANKPVNKFFVKKFVMGNEDGLLGKSVLFETESSRIPPKSERTATVPDKSQNQAPTPEPMPTIKAQSTPLPQQNRTPKKTVKVDDIISDREKVKDDEQKPPRRIEP